MDPPLASLRDPVVLLAELIDLLRDIKDAATADKTAAAAAAVDAIRRVVARPNEHATSSLPGVSASPKHASSDTAPRAHLYSEISAGPALTHESSLAAAHADPTSSAPTSVAVVPGAPTTTPTLPSEQTRPSASTHAKPDTAVRKPRPRNLIVCIDGTSNQFSKKNTNVVELYHRLVKDETQLTFYNSGIGTYATPSWKSWKYFKQVLYNKIDLAIAWNFEKILLSAYLWLCENYREGDRIFLFGFSRGAYQVRALSAMIDSVGLLYKGNQDQIPFAYQLYAETKRFDQVGKMRLRFKETFSQVVVVELVAVWDTVSSVGLVRDKTLPGTTEGMRHVRYFRHALALHERRVKFLPENARAGSGPREQDIKPDIPGGRPHTKEVWFAGSHSDIGGGAITNDNLDRFGPALRWISFEAMLAGVRLKDGPQEWERAEVNNSMGRVWKLFELMPFARLTYRGESTLTHRLHLGRPRKIQANQLIHETALEASQDPLVNSWCARLPEGLQWSELRERGLVEEDPYMAAGAVLERLRGLTTSIMPDSDIAQLRAVASTWFGQEYFRDSEHQASEIFMAALTRAVTRADDSEVHDTLATIDAIVFAVQECGILYADSPLPNARRYAAELARVDKQCAERFLEIASPPVIGVPLKHPQSVFCVAYMPDGEHIVTGSYDGAVRVWNVSSGELVGVPMVGHVLAVRSVAVSRSRIGTRIVSGAWDQTVRIWDAETGATLGALKGHTGGVHAVAFSPDGRRVVSGAEDHTVRVWDVMSGATVVGPLDAHAYEVWAVAFSPDGSRVASGSLSGSVCIWDSVTGVNLWQVVIPSSINSIAYSPDGSRIAVGSATEEVLVLNAETGTRVLGPLKMRAPGASKSPGSTPRTWVRTVAYSPDGRKIASGSNDSKVRLWDAETGEELDVLRGHRFFVSSVAFAPNGNYVASASADTTVRVWDATGVWKRLDDVD